MKKLSIILSILTVLLITSCATTISTEVQRPAELNLHGANSISVLPFQTSYYDDFSRVKIINIFRDFFDYEDHDNKKRIASYLTREITEELLNSDFMEVVGSKKVQRALEYDSDIPCDVYLTGYIADYHDDIDEKWDEDNENYYFVRNVSLNITYEIIDSKTNRVISRKSKAISKKSDRKWDIRDLPSAYDLVHSDLDSLITKIMKQLQPYTETKDLTLYEDKSKLESMKIAKNFAKDGYLEKSQKMYADIYEETEIFEAGYNAAILLQAQGNLADAEELMEKVYMKTANRKAYNALNDIRSEIKSADKLQAQLNLKNSH